MSMRSLDVHLVAKLLQLAFNRVVGSALALSVHWLDVLHVLLRLYLDHCRLSEYHYLNYTHHIH